MRALYVDVKIDILMLLANPDPKNLFFCELQQIYKSAKSANYRS